MQSWHAFGSIGRRATVIIVALPAILLAFGCGLQRPPSGKVIVAVGDIASCSSTADEATARLVGGIDGATVLTLGDEAYPEGTPEEFEECYKPTWGRTKPVPTFHALV
jgi:hypothetical protein